MRNLRRRGLAAVLIGTAAAGLLVVSASTASAGAWFWTGESWSEDDGGQAACNYAGYNDVLNSGGDITNWNCQYDAHQDWDLYEFQS
jgi:hypothetical protein